MWGRRSAVASRALPTISGGPAYVVAVKVRLPVAHTPGQRGRCGCCALQSAQLGVVPVEAAGTPYRTRPRVRTFGSVPVRHWGNQDVTTGRLLDGDRGWTAVGSVS